MTREIPPEITSLLDREGVPLKRAREIIQLYVEMEFNTLRRKVKPPTFTAYLADHSPMWSLSQDAQQGLVDLFHHLEGEFSVTPHPEYEDARKKLDALAKEVKNLFTPDKE